LFIATVSSDAFYAVLPEKGKWISAEADKEGMINDIVFAVVLLTVRARYCG